MIIIMYLNIPIIIVLYISIYPHLYITTHTYTTPYTPIQHHILLYITIYPYTSPYIPIHHHVYIPIHHHTPLYRFVLVCTMLQLQDSRGGSKKNDALSYRIFLITRECVTNTMILITSISKQNLQTTVITVISFRQIPGYSIDSRFGIRGCVTIEQRKMLFSFQRHRDCGETK